MSTSLTRGLNVLDVLVGARGPLKLAEIAEAVGYSKSSVHGLLATLVDCGYVEHVSGGTYRLGFKAWRVGHAFPTAELIRIAEPIMGELVEQIEEGAILGVLDGFDVVYVHLVPSRQAVRVHAEVGERIPGHSTSTGLALLAFQDAGYVEKTMPPKLAPFSPETITDLPALMAELERTRMRGFSVNRGGWHADVGGIAAPIIPANSIVTAGLCVALPRYRMTQEWVNRVGPIIVRSAAEIAHGLDRTLGGVAGLKAS
jgi:DNA-binding IclR family transcriptional regulator